MRDLVFLAIVIGFFALAAVYVTACGHIAAREDATDAGEAFDSQKMAR